MAGKKPSFITGANAKIQAGGITIAYAQDVSYNVTVTTIPIETMGRYEVVSNEPVAYFVDGTLSVIRYSKVAAGMSGAAANGNGIGNWKFANPAGTNASQHMNPGQLLASQTWDLDIYQKFDNSGTVDSQDVITLHDCRLTRKGGAINKRGVLVEQFSFNAILQDDDSFTSANSGDGDLSS
jgi:hypothetical protein